MRVGMVGRRRGLRALKLDDNGWAVVQVLRDDNRSIPGRVCHGRRHKPIHFYKRFN